MLGTFVAHTHTICKLFSVIIFGVSFALFATACNMTWNENLAEWLELSKERGRTVYYVSANSTVVSPNGTQNAPFATISDALKILTNKNKKYTIKINGAIEENITIDESVQAKSITLEGYADVSWVAPTNAQSLFTLSSSTPVTLKHIDVKGFYDVSGTETMCSKVILVKDGATLFLEDIAIEMTSSIKPTDACNSTCVYGEGKNNIYIDERCEFRRCESALVFNGETFCRMNGSIIESCVAISTNTNTSAKVEFGGKISTCFCSDTAYPYTVDIAKGTTFTMTGGSISNNQKKCVGVKGVIEMGGSACVGLWENGKQTDSDAIYLLRSYPSGMPAVEPSIKIISPIEKGNAIGHIYTNEDEIGGYENKTLFTGPYAESARREYKIPQTRIEGWDGPDNAVMWRFKANEETPTEVARAYFSTKGDNDIIYVQAFDEWTSCSVRITRGEEILCPNTETSITGALEATTEGSMTVYILTIPITYTGDEETPYIIELQKEGTVVVSCELFE